MSKYKKNKEICTILLNEILKWTQKKVSKNSKILHKFPTKYAKISSSLYEITLRK